MLCLYEKISDSTAYQHHILASSQQLTSFDHLIFLCLNPSILPNTSLALFQGRYMKKLLFFLVIFFNQSLIAYTITFALNKGDSAVSPSFLQQIKADFGSSIFVETGTYSGESTKVAAQIFPEIYSVELNQNLYNQACSKFTQQSHVHLYQGHSPEFLRSICPTLHARSSSIVFWLDAHECGTGHYHDIVTPIVEELRALAECNMNDAIVLIDDMRCFGSTIGDHEIYAFDGYPSFQKICSLLKDINPNYTCILAGDTLIAYDAMRYNPSISPVAYACTYSRMYNTDDTNDEIVNYESVIAKAIGKELETINYVYRDTTLFDSSEFHAYLWTGLIASEHGNHKKALTEFTRVLNKGYTHWRIYWYQAQAAFNSGNETLALEALTVTLAIHKTYAPALNLKKKIKSFDVGVIQ